MKRLALLLPLLLACENPPTGLPEPVYEVRLFYAYPEGAEDRGLALADSVKRSVAIAQYWLVEHTGVRLRLNDRLTIAELVGWTAEDMNAAKVHAVLEIAIAKLLAPGQIAFVYYDGHYDKACGGSAWPPTLPGKVAAAYLKSTLGGCDREPFLGRSSTGVSFGYRERQFLHDTLHLLGIIPPPDGPHSLDSSDLMCGTGCKSALYIGDGYTDLITASPYAEEA